jgi:phosphatidylglycerol:prolipoprotein diacylglycerol transferase
VFELFPSRTVALQIGPLAVHWYGVLYLCAFLVAYLLLPRLQKYRDVSLHDDQWSEILTLGVLGVLLGGRLGFVLFYEPAYFVQHPLEILAVWQGGMSSHGGLLGVMSAVLWFCRKHRVSVLAMADLVVVPAAIGLAFGRLGNFINLELYGYPTDLPWGIAIPGVEGLRHPTQLYAVAKDLFIASACFFALLRFARPGLPTAFFFLLYSVLRFLIEFVKVPSHDPLVINGFSLTLGQIFTIPVFVLGIALFVFAQKKRA